MMKQRAHWFVGTVIVVIVLLSLFQTWEFAKRTPSDAVYPLVHGYMPDYYWYLSLMEQGTEGMLRLTSHHTPEPFPPQFVNTFFPFFGIVANGIGLSLPVMYLILRIVFGISLLAMGFFLATTLFASLRQRFFAFALMVIGVPLWFWDGTTVRTYGDFWAELDPIVRISYLPHHLAANSVLIATFLLFSYAFKNRKLWFAIVSGLTGACAIWLNPASLFPIVGALGFAIILEPRRIPQRIPTILIFFAIIFLPVAALMRLEHSVFPWTAFRDWERLVSYPIDVPGYLKVLGLSAIPAILVIPAVAAKRDVLWRLIAGWFLTPIVGLGLLQWYLPVSNARYLQSAAYIPTALLAAYGIESFTSWLTRRGITKTASIAFILLFFIGVSIPSYSASISQQMRSVDRDSRNLLIYVPKGVTEGMNWLNQNGQKGQVVAAPGWVSTMIPAFTNKRTLTGHPTFTYNGSEKQYDLDRLFQMTDQAEGERILGKYGVRYLWAESSSSESGRFLQRMGLAPVFSNSAVTIYEGVR